MKQMSSFLVLLAFISYLPTGLFFLKCCIFMHQFMLSPDTDSWKFINMKKQCQKKKRRYMWRLWLTKVNSTQTMDNLYLNFHQEATKERTKTLLFHNLMLIRPKGAPTIHILFTSSNALSPILSKLSYYIIIITVRQQILNYR